MSQTLALIAILVAIIAFGGWASWYALRSSGTTTKRWLIGATGCVAFLLVFATIAAVILPVMNSARHAAKNTACISNLNYIGKAFLMYQADTDGRMPLQGWTEAIGGYVGSREVYQCPMLAGSYGYAMSEKIVGLDVNTVDAHRSIAAFDGPGGKDSIGGANDIQFRHDDKYAYVNFLDGHSRGYERKDIPPLLHPNKR